MCTNLGPPSARTSLMAPEGLKSVTDRYAEQAYRVFLAVKHVCKSAQDYKIRFTEDWLILRNKLKNMGIGIL